MLVIHPIDDTTDFLRTLYGGMEEVALVAGDESRNRLTRRLYHLPRGETVMLLGHGGPDGLYRREGDGYRCYVGRSMGYCLRRHPLVGIWCHSALFAERNRLHGLFSGMIVSEMEEAREFGIKTTEEELRAENRRFAATLRNLLESGVPTGRIPALMKESIQDGPEVRAFNYCSVYCL